MKILNNGVEQEVKVLTYFKMKNETNIESDYIIYTDIENEGTNVYISGVFYEDDHVKLIKPIPESLNPLKKIIQNLISNNPNKFIFSQNKFQYIEVEKLNNKIVEKIEFQRISLNMDQYKNMLSSAYLTYPYSNLTDIKKPEGFKGKYNAMADTISIVVSSVLLLLIIGGLIAYQFDWDLFKNGVFNIDKILTNFLTFDFYVHNYLIIQVAILAFVLTLLAFNSEKSHPILFWFITTLVIFSIYLLWLNVNKVPVFDHFNLYFKTIGVYSICISLVITIPYVLCKEVTSIITNKLSFCNFISYYTIYFIMFAFTFIGLGLFYNNYLVEHVTKFISDII